ncbi:MAG: glycosyltransferase family 9 protein [Candidatus Deferrimicrobium sp.]
MDRPLLPPPSSILVVCIRLIGDVILSTPLVGLLKSVYPDAQIDYLVNRGTGEFLEKDPRIRGVFYTRNREARKPVGNPEPGYFRKIVCRYDMAINLNASDRGNFVVILAGRKVRVGFHPVRFRLRDVWKRVGMTHPVPFPFAIHVARVSQLAAEAVGIPVPRLEVKVFWDREDEARVDGLLRREGVHGPFFAVHPFARWKYKYWLPDRFANVSDEIAGRYGIRPVWTSSPDPEEVRLLREAAALCRIRPALCAGEFTLNQMTYLLSRASLYVGLDTAVSHLAATTGVPMVVLFGPTIAERWSPWNNEGPVEQQCPLPRGTQRAGRMILIQKDWDCVPCGKAGCGDEGGESRCLTEIQVPEVLDAVRELMGGRSDTAVRGAG